MPTRQLRARAGTAGRPADACLLDLNGTLLADDRRAVPGAPEAVAELRRAGIPFRVLTNTTRWSRSTVAERLAAAGIEVAPEECLTAVTAAAAWVRRQRLKKVVLLLAPEAAKEFSGVAIVSEEADCVVVGDLGPAWSFERLDEAFRALMGGAELLALQRNRYWKHDGRLTLDAGPFVAALEYASGKKAHLAGKPSAAFFAAAVESLGIAADRVVAVGDDLEADVAGARSAGLLGVAVRTGKFRREDDARAQVIAKAVLSSVAELPDWLRL